MQVFPGSSLISSPLLLRSLFQRVCRVGVVYKFCFSRESFGCSIDGMLTGELTQVTSSLVLFIYLFQSIILPLGVGSGKDVQAYGLKT